MTFNRPHVLLFSAFLVLLGLLGIHQHVEYSGWVLFVGLLGAIFNIEKDDEATPREKYAKIWREGFDDCESGLEVTDNPYIE